MRTLNDLVRQGKVRYVGCSNFAAWEVVRAMETANDANLEPFISVQPEYNLLNRNAQRELIPCCRAYGLGILPYYPLAEGFLTGKYQRGEAPPKGMRLAGKPDSAEALLEDRNFDLLAKLDAFAAERGHAVAELAIAWLLANSLVSSVIAGATKPWQVDANVKAAGWELTAEDLRLLGEILGDNR
jgi:aryl-alcohol dehydrogenase-like predicted oxidoreductase